ncbi:MAG: hypothetical protein SPG05_03635 [Candidatus Cryptobacteroides sp.]|nr:hypothetical protein [Candidatus Cryptobacteroides sp.]
MTIESFTSCLEEFIMEHDRLLVPGLGSFTAGLQAATISDNGFTINPPYRKLEFIYGEDLGIGENEQYDYLYSIKEKMDLEKVREELAEIISEIKREVEANSLVELPGLGKLRSLGDGHLFFVMDKDAQIYPEGFALSSVSLKNRVSGIPEVVAAPKPVEQPVAATEGHNEAVSKEQKVADGLARKKKKMPVVVKVILWLLGIALLLLAGFMALAYFCPDFIDTLLYSPDEIELLKTL